jgi:ABC-type phosphate transport system substrate-binding protein
VQTTTHAPATLSTAQLKAIFTCTSTKWNQVGGTSTATIKPFLPQSGSGTRAFFLTAIGVTDAQVGSCVTQGVQENQGTDARLKNIDAIAPYSVAKFIAQKFHSALPGHTPGPGQNKFGRDEHGTLKLDSINGKAPTTGTGSSTTINPGFTPSFMRNVFNVVRTATTADKIPAYLEPIFGKGGFICAKAGTTVKNYGFLPLPSTTCGSVS